MVQQIVFTKRAGQELQWILKYLEQRFGERVVAEFSTLFESALAKIRDNPIIAPPLPHSPGLRHLVIHRRTIIIYRYRPRLGKIEIASIWDTRRNPAKRKY